METDILTKATILYEAGSYKNAIDECVHFLESDQFKDYDKKSELYEILALSNLFLLHTPTDEKANDIIYHWVMFAASEAKDEERMYNLEKNIANSFHDWQNRLVHKNLDYLKENLSLENYKKYLEIGIKYCEMDLMITMAISSTRKEKGFNKSKYQKTFEEINQDQLEYEAACDSFDKTRRIFDENKEGNLEFVKALTNKTLERTNVEELLLNVKEDSGIYLKALKKKAEIEHFVLSSVAYPNGNPVFIYYHTDSNKRKERIQELSDLYDKIKSIDSSFVSPELPPVGGTTSSQSNGTQNTSGGCYIATAVYGSYDCPQVWTLRRYRDNTLSKTWVGRAFIRTYYFFSPTLVKLFGKTNWFRLLWKPYLDKKVKRLHDLGVEDTPYNDKRR